MPLAYERGTVGRPQAPRARGLTLRLQVAEQRLGVVQGAGGYAAHAVLSQAAGGAQQWVPILGCTVGIRDGRTRGPDQGQGHHALYHALWGGLVSERPPGARMCIEHLAVCGQWKPI